MKRPGYREAIEWLALNDDNEWVDDEDKVPSVTACLIADLFAIDTDKVTKDLRRRLEKEV
jgi:hypothetical protein